VIAKDQLFIPIARPLRWSLVTPNLGGFAENARAIHPLNRLASTKN
jgi:peptide/nickel transport system substrate-binding protein